MTLAVRARSLRALLALPLLAVPASLQASGFAIESQGSRAMGFAGAYVAQATDPSAIFFNAAGIGFLKGKHLYITGALSSRSSDFIGVGPKPPAGTLESSTRSVAVLPSIYYSQQVGDKAVFGLGVSRPFDNRLEWQNPDAFTGRYICVACQIDSWSINPTIALRLADRFAIGAGVDVRFSSFELRHRLLADPNPFPVPTDVAEQTIASSRDRGIGFNVGMLAMPSENVSIGLAYRHEVKIDHAAQASFTQILTGNLALDQAVAIALPSSQPATVSFSYPASVAAGVALRRGYWTVEADFQYLMWSSFDAITISYLETSALDNTLQQDWLSSWRAAIGIEYLIRDDWELRMGYGYDRNPAPPETISPFIHDAARHSFGAGGTWKYENVRLDFNLRYLLFQTTSTLGLSSYDYNGAYKPSGLQLGASLGYRF